MVENAVDCKQARLSTTAPSPSKKILEQDLLRERIADLAAATEQSRALEQSQLVEAADWMGRLREAEAWLHDAGDALVARERDIDERTFICEETAAYIDDVRALSIELQQVLRNLSDANCSLAERLSQQRAQEVEVRKQVREVCSDAEKDLQTRGSAPMLISPQEVDVFASAAYRGLERSVERQAATLASAATDAREATSALSYKLCDISAVASDTAQVRGEADLARLALVAESLRTLVDRATEGGEAISVVAADCEDVLRRTVDVLHDVLGGDHVDGQVERAVELTKSLRTSCSEIHQAYASLENEARESLVHPIAGLTELLRGCSASAQRCLDIVAGGTALAAESDSGAGDRGQSFQEALGRLIRGREFAASSLAHRLPEALALLGDTLQQGCGFVEDLVHEATCSIEESTTGIVDASKAGQDCIFVATQEMGEVVESACGLSEPLLTSLAVALEPAVLAPDGRSFCGGLPGDLFAAHQEMEDIHAMMSRELALLRRQHDTEIKAYEYARQPLAITQEGLEQTRALNVSANLSLRLACESLEILPDEQARICDTVVERSAELSQHFLEKMQGMCDSLTADLHAQDAKLQEAFVRLGAADAQAVAAQERASRAAGDALLLLELADEEYAGGEQAGGVGQQLLLADAGADSMYRELKLVVEDVPPRLLSAAKQLVVTREATQQRWVAVRDAAHHCVSKFSSKQNGEDQILWRALKHQDSVGRDVAEVRAGISSQGLLAQAAAQDLVAGEREHAGALVTFADAQKLGFEEDEALEQRRCDGFLALADLLEFSIPGLGQTEFNARQLVSVADEHSAQLAASPWGAAINAVAAMERLSEEIRSWGADLIAKKAELCVLNAEVAKDVRQSSIDAASTVDEQVYVAKAAAEGLRRAINASAAAQEARMSKFMSHYDVFNKLVENSSEEVTRSAVLASAARGRQQEDREAVHTSANQWYSALDELRVGSEEAAARQLWHFRCGLAAITGEADCLPVSARQRLVR